MVELLDTGPLPLPDPFYVGLLSSVHSNVYLNKVVTL